MVAAIVGSLIWRRRRAKVATPPASPTAPAESDLEEAQLENPPPPLTPPPPFVESVHTKDDGCCEPHQIAVKACVAERLPSYPMVTMGQCTSDQDIAKIV